jgi:hypothetical protein
VLNADLRAAREGPCIPTAENGTTAESETHAVTRNSGHPPTTVAATLGTVLMLAACGGSSASSSTTTKPAAAKTPAIPVCYDAAKSAMAGFLGIQAQQITTAQFKGTSGNPDCSYTTGSGQHRIKLLADDYTGGQPYFILERTAEEASQLFVPTRTVAPPQAINMGLAADWFPAREQLMATDGLKLITTTVSWVGVAQKHRLALAEAFTKPYIKVTRQGRAAANDYP